MSFLHRRFPSIPHFCPRIVETVVVEAEGAEAANVDVAVVAPMVVPQESWDQ